MRFGGKGASTGDLSLLFHIVKLVELVLFRSQDAAQFSLQRYRQLHVLSLDCMDKLILEAQYFA